MHKKEDQDLMFTKHYNEILSKSIQNNNLHFLEHKLNLTEIVKKDGHLTLEPQDPFLQEDFTRWKTKVKVSKEPKKKFMNDDSFKIRAYAYTENYFRVNLS